MTAPAFTCLIPAYNEAARIAGVLAAVHQHPLLYEVIVIDDGSTDDTARIAESCGARVIRTSGNLGKTHALVHGFRKVATTHVVLLDADLIGLTASDVTALVSPVRDGWAVASISLRGNAPWVWRMIGIDYISGERALPCQLVTEHLDAMIRLPRFGFEVFLNQLLLGTGRQVAIVPLPDVASPSKATKRGLIRGVVADLAMLIDIFRTVSPYTALHQIWTLRSRRMGMATRGIARQLSMR